MRNIKKVIIAGGTGFLGYAAAEQFLKKNIEVDIIALQNELANLDFVDKRIGIKLCDLFGSTDSELKELFLNQKYDALIYALGPDDRITPNAPAYDFFHERLVEKCKNIISAAKSSGIEHVVVLSSYFAYFNKILSGKLEKYHPYIKCRAEQQKECSLLCDENFSVSYLELPYIFGIAEGRTPIWKDSFLSHFDGFNNIYFPSGGGTAIIDRIGVAEAVVACTIYGESKTAYPIATDNITFKELLKLMLKGMNDKRKIIQIPAFLCALGTHGMVKKQRKQGKEAGLYYPKVMTQILSKKFYIDPQTSMENLHFKKLGYSGGNNAREEIFKTMKFFEK